MAGAILGFVPGLLDSFASPKAALLRALGLPMLVLALARALARARRDGVAALAPHDAPGWADAAAATWAVVAVLSALAGLAPRVSVLGEPGQREGALTSLALAGLWFGARASHRDAAQARRTRAVAFAAAALAGGYALAQFAGADPLAWEGEHRYLGRVRPAGTLGNPILLGAVVAAVCAGGAAIAAAGSTSPWLLPALAVAAAALVATLSRGAWAAGAAAVALALVPAMLAGPPPRRRGATVALGAIGGTALLFGVLAVRGPALARLAESVAGGASSASARVVIARGALQLARAHPWFGTGPDTFGLAFTRVQSADLWRRGWFGLPVHAHSAPLQALATTGALGALAMAAWIACTLVAARRARGGAGVPGLVPAACALLVASLFNPVGIAGAALFVLLGALAVGARDAPPPAPGRAATALAALACLAALAAFVPEALALRHAAQARADLQAIAALPAAQRLAGARAAWTAASRAGRAWGADDELARLACDAALARADAALLAGFPREALRSAEAADSCARAAVRAVPVRAANLQRAAGARAALARAAAAVSDPRAPALAAQVAGLYAAARAFAPVDALLLADEARAALVLGRLREARVAAERVATLYPEAATGHLLVAAVCLAEGRMDAAREVLVRALAAEWEEGSEAQRASAQAMLRRLDEAER